MAMELTVMLIMVFVPPAIFALIVSYLCDMSRTVFLGGFATGLTIIIASEMVGVEYLVFPILIMAYLVWTLAFSGGVTSE